MKNFLLFLVFLFFFSVSQGQINGYVYDSNSQLPLAYSSIYLKKSRVGTITNQDGKFSLKSKYKIDTLIVRYIGYKEQCLNVVSDSNISIALRQNTIKLSQVDIIGSTSLELAKIIHKSIQAQNFNTKIIKCKSFAKLLTFQEDTFLRESFEAFYTATLNKYDIEENTFKSGRFLRSKVTPNTVFRTIDLFSNIIPSIKLYEPKIKNNYRKKELIVEKSKDIQLNTPINAYYVSDIIHKF